MKKANEMDLTFCVPSGFFIPLFSNPFLNILKKVKKKRKIRKNLQLSLLFGTYNPQNALIVLRTIGLPWGLKLFEVIPPAVGSAFQSQNKKPSNQGCA